ncbi:hypothetical protein GQ53DRAFT_667371 [Thozetella sp. PMI_491]|nr:hypothetical protein GQ53DRAFT_667371 [Thozetella sp. PMI_491]
MIDHSRRNLAFIRTCIGLLEYAPHIEAAISICLVGYCTLSPTPPGSGPVAAARTFLGLWAAELAFALVLYRPHKARLLREARHPEPLTRAERDALFERCLENVPDKERYLRQWCLGADSRDIKRENVKEFFLWAFFDRDGSYRDSASVEEEVEAYLDRTEQLLGRKLPSGRGPAKSLRLTLDDVDTRYRSVIWYGIVGFVDFISYAALSLKGYRYYASSLRRTLTLFPPRLQALPSLLPFPGLKKRRSSSGEIGYWLRPHTSRTRLPIVFIHGIGIGLFPYLQFLAEIKTLDGGGDDGQVGVLALEVLSMSMRLTSPPLPQEEFIAHITAILGQHAPEWDRFVLVSHSYGSVLTTHMLRSETIGPRIRGVMLVDPVSLLLHLPDVAYNFTRRRPRKANEWQLWYFASMDLGVAEGLGRHFFWRENIIWKDELATLNTVRKVGVFLSGNDLIVDTRAVARYLSCPGSLGEAPDDAPEYYKLVEDQEIDTRVTCRKTTTASGMHISWFPRLDHAQIFEHKETQEQLLGMLKELTMDRRG